MTAARCVVVLIVLVMRAACAADFSAGVELYARGDYKGAFEQWQALARESDSRAQYRLARMLANGVETRKDDRAALHWYRQAAEGAMRGRR